MFDMIYTFDGENFTYESTNNLYVLLYLCYHYLLITGIALAFDNKLFKQSSMAILAFPVISILATLDPHYHESPLQIVWDILYAAGAIGGTYIFIQEMPEIKEQLHVLFYA